ncbi:hypothetical protein HDU67_007059 [Dinochytrium kinnereticum]|nr:hypothetical protein HDU67_007059 [Dinochytrium kinnereticum]
MPIRTPPPERGPLLVSLLATILAMVGAGTQYVYSVFGPQLLTMLYFALCAGEKMATHFGFSGKMASTIASAVNLGYYGSGAAWGHFVDGSSSNPMVFFLLSGGLVVSGYFTMAGFYEEPVGVGGSGMAALGIGVCYFVVGVGSAGTYAAAIGTNMRNWDPKYRGIATGIPLAALGLSASLYALVASIFFVSSEKDGGLDVHRFLIFLGCTTLFLNLIASITLKDLRPRRIPDVEEEPVINVPQARDRFHPAPNDAYGRVGDSGWEDEEELEPDPMLRSVSPIHIVHLAYIDEEASNTMRRLNAAPSLGQLDDAVTPPAPRHTALASVGLASDAIRSTSATPINDDTSSDLQDWSATPQPHDPPSHLDDLEDDETAPSAGFFRILSDPEAFVLALCLMFISGAGLGYTNAVGTVVASLDAGLVEGNAGSSSTAAQSLHVAILSIVGCFARVFSGVVSDRLAARSRGDGGEVQGGMEAVSNGVEEQRLDVEGEQDRDVDVVTPLTTAYGGSDVPQTSPVGSIPLPSHSGSSASPRGGWWWTLGTAQSDGDRSEASPLLMTARREWRDGLVGGRVRSLRLDRVFWVVFAATVMGWAHWRVAFLTFELGDLVLPTVAVGVAYGTIMTVVPVVVAEAFGPQYFATNWGALRIATAIGGQIFGIVFGDLYDRELRRQTPGLASSSLQVTSASWFLSSSPHQGACVGRGCFSMAFFLSFGCNVVAAMLALGLFWRRQMRYRGVGSVVGRG